MTDPVIGTENNGVRKDVAFYNYIGRAGVLERDGFTQVAFRHNDNPKLKVGLQGTIEGELYEIVEKRVNNNGVKGMITLLTTKV